MRPLEQIESDIQKKLNELNKLRRERVKHKSLKSKRFIFRCSYDIILEVGEIWPDGDTPLNPTVRDVMKVINEAPSHACVLDEWNLRPDDGENAKIVVSHYKGN